MRLILTLISIIICNTVYSQTENILTMAFSVDNGKALSSFFNQTIDLKLPDEEGIYTKEQAKLVLSDFFNKNPISGYQEKHIGGGKEKAIFHIGFFESNKKKYRTYILYNKIQDKPQIIEFRIEFEE